MTDQDQSPQPTHDPVRWIIKLQHAAQQQGVLSLWTIYNHPSDYPDNFVARRFTTDREGIHVTENVMVGQSLSGLRMVMRMSGLTCIQRSPQDDPKILETWL